MILTRSGRWGRFRRIWPIAEQPADVASPTVSGRTGLTAGTGIHAPEPTGLRQTQTRILL
jgi:hypothetical protein